jgi:hypothetical protein
VKRPPSLNRVGFTKLSDRFEDRNPRFVVPIVARIIIMLIGPQSHVHQLNILEDSFMFAKDVD